MILFDDGATLMTKSAPGFENFGLQPVTFRRSQREMHSRSERNSQCERGRGVISLSHVQDLHSAQTPEGLFDSYEIGYGLSWMFRVTHGVNHRHIVLRGECTHFVDRIVGPNYKGVEIARQYARSITDCFTSRDLQIVRAISDWHRPQFDRPDSESRTRTGGG